MPILSQTEIQKTVVATIASGMNATNNRGALLQSIDPAFAALLPYNPAPAPQLMMDLGMMNQVERLANGQIPLAIYLGNLSLLLSGTQQQTVVVAILDEVEHRTSGAPRLDPAKLPETKERIIHVNDMVPLAFMELGCKAAAAVVKLRVPRYEAGQKRLLNGNPMLYLGTGWLVTPSLLMTNHHVVNARNEGEPAAPTLDLNLQAQNTIGLLDYDADNLAGTDLPVHSLQASDPTLDYALLRVPSTGRQPLRRCAQSIVKGADPIPVNIIQHPGGRGKRLGIRNNLVSASTATDLRYFTDTEAGSSGSPVLNDQWEVVALHRASVYVTNVQFQGRDTAYVNLGTHLLPILKDIAQRFPTLAAEIGV
jgi:endonuclease G